MKIIMLQNTMGSNYGYDSKRFAKDKVYCTDKIEKVDLMQIESTELRLKLASELQEKYNSFISEDLAKIFLENKWAKKYSITNKLANKMISSASEIKDDFEEEVVEEVEETKEEVEKRIKSKNILKNKKKR